MLLRKTLPTLRKPLLLLFIFAFLLFLYMLLHEAGHALAGLLVGGTLQAFEVDLLRLSAHAEVAGRFSPAGLSLMSAAGVALPLLAWAGFVLAVPRRANPVLRLARLIGSWGVLNSLWPWMVIPLLYRLGLAPPGDDTTRFLVASGLDPRVVAGAAAGAYLAGWGLFLARIEGLREELALLMASGEELLGNGGRRALLAMVAVWVVAGVLVAAGLPAGFS